MNEPTPRLKVHTRAGKRSCKRVSKRAGDRGGRGSRSGRYSTAAVYRGTAPQSDAECSQSGEHTRDLPPIVKSSPGLATDYHCRLGPRAIARIRLTRKSVDHSWIDWVFVPPSHRGTGLARRLMGVVLADADAEGARLSLEARACAGLSQEALEAWYGGLGFERTPFQGDFGRILVRAAQEQAAARRAA
jgi:predicted GNAT family acetyltransferase